MARQMSAAIFTLMTVRRVGLFVCRLHCAFTCWPLNPCYSVKDLWPIGVDLSLNWDYKYESAPFPLHSKTWQTPQYCTMWAESGCHWVVQSWPRNHCVLMQVCPAWTHNVKQCCKDNLEIDFLLQRAKWNVGVGSNKLMKGDGSCFVTTWTWTRSLPVVLSGFTLAMNEPKFHIMLLLVWFEKYFLKSYVVSFGD